MSLRAGRSIKSILGGKIVFFACPFIKENNVKYGEKPTLVIKSTGQYTKSILDTYNFTIIIKQKSIKLYVFWGKMGL